MTIDKPYIPISAVTGAGRDDLLLAIEAITQGMLEPLEVLLPYKRGDLVSLFHERGQVENDEHTADGVKLQGRLPERLIPYFEAYRV